MFPSPPNSNCDTPNFESLLKRSSSFPPHQNPTSNSSCNPSLLFNFPSPFLDEHESPLNQIFSQNHDLTKPINLGKSKMEQRVTQPDAEEIPRPRLRRSLDVIPRRRPGKKDRHSKICTAQGIRDRRMRLSLQVARKFFDLQDMLGYDKASKTIEWLFNQSKKAINELVDDVHHQSPPPENNGEAKSESFVSECEEMSGIEETNSSNVLPTSDTDPLTSYRSNARESRDRARARARFRTREKMLVKLHLSGDCFQPNPNDLGKLNRPFQGVDQELNLNIEGIRVSPLEEAYNSVKQQLSDVGAIEKFLGNSSPSTSCPTSDYADPTSSSFMGFLGNWDVLSSDRTNCLHYSVTNQFSFSGNLTAEFPDFS